jgi:hypothetical protein
MHFKVPKTLMKVLRSAQLLTDYRERLLETNSIAVVKGFDTVEGESVGRCTIYIKANYSFNRCFTTSGTASVV